MTYWKITYTVASWRWKHIYEPDAVPGAFTFSSSFVPVKALIGRKYIPVSFKWKLRFRESDFPKVIHC